MKKKPTKHIPDFLVRRILDTTRIQSMPLPSETRLSDFYTDLYEPLALRSRRENTKRLYLATIKSFRKFLGRDPFLSDLDDMTVSRFALSRVESGLSKYTVNKDLFNLLAIWRWAYKKDYLKNWPDVGLETTPKISPIALSREELARVAQSIKEEKEPVGDFSGSDFFSAIFLLIWDTGERIGAVMSLDWNQVDLPGGWVRFEADTRKGGAADNVLRIATDTASAMGRLSPRNGIVFKWPYSSTYIYRRLAEIMTRAGLPDSKAYKFHCIRKSTASHYEAAGGNATQLLGHSSRKITMAYLDPRIVRTTPAVDLLFRPGETNGKAVEPLELPERQGGDVGNFDAEANGIPDQPDRADSKRPDLPSYSPNAVMESDWL